MSNLGRINITYEGDLNDRGDTTSSPSPQQAYNFLLSNGVNRNRALMLTGAAASESNLDPTAVHDHGVGYGMFGHNGSRLMQMYQFAKQRGTPISDWGTQLLFAAHELDGRPEAKAIDNATTPEQLTHGQMFFERPQGFSPDDPTQGHNYLGRLNTIRKFTALDPTATGAFSPSANPQISSGQAAGAGIGGGSSYMPSLNGLESGATSSLGGTSPDVAPANPFAQVGNPQLNAALAQILSQSRQQPAVQKPLISQLLGAAVSPLRQGLVSGLSSLLGGPSASGTADGVSQSGAPSATVVASPPPATAPSVEAASRPFDPPMPVPRPPEFGGAVQMADGASTGGKPIAPVFTLGGVFGATGSSN